MENRPLKREYNLTQAAELLDLHRGTIRSKVKEAGITPVRTERGTPLYLLSELARACFHDSNPIAFDPENASPKDLKDWYQAQRERLKYEIECRQVIPAQEVLLEKSKLAKAVANTLDVLPDILEREHSIPADVIKRIQEIADEIRQSMYEAILSADDDDPV